MRLNPTKETTLFFVELRIFRHYLVPVPHSGPSETALSLRNLPEGVPPLRVGTLTRSECIIVIIYGWYQSFILISW